MKRTENAKNYFFRFFLGQSSFLSGQDFSSFLQAESFLELESDFLHSPPLQDSFLSQPDFVFPQSGLPEVLVQSDLPLAFEAVPFLIGQDLPSFLQEESFLELESDFLHSPPLQGSFLSQPDLHFPQQDFPSFFPHEDLPQSDFPFTEERLPLWESHGFLA